jgi:rubredoxin
VSDETQVQQDAADQEHGSEEMHPIDVQLPANAPDAASEAAEEKAEEVSDPRTHRFECRSCGYVYDPEEGVKKQAIPIGTAFQDIDTITFRCPVCRSKVGAFRDIGPRSKASGFEENLNFGLGVNRLTPGQKNVLIFGGLALAFAFFLSLYSLR